MATTWINRGHFYTPHVQSILVDCNFTVAPADAAGLGITGLKGQGIDAVFMHTSTTPGKNALGYLNPNPAAGNIVVKFSDNYNRLYNMLDVQAPPLSGTPLTSTTAGVLYVITALGTTTLAQWLAAGVQPGVVPAVGVSFVAIATGAIGGTGAVQVPATTYSGFDHIEIVGDPNTSIFPVNVGGSPNVGGWVNLACISANALTAPGVGSLIRLAFYMGQSSVAVKGE